MKIFIYKLSNMHNKLEKFDLLVNIHDLEVY